MSTFRERLALFICPELGDRIDYLERTLFDCRRTGDRLLSKLRKTRRYSKNRRNEYGRERKEDNRH